MDGDHFDCFKYISYDRCIGSRVNIGFGNRLHKHLYTHFLPNADHVALNDPGVSSGIFNLEYSSDGKCLVAACADKSVRLLDPVQQKITFTRENAHRNCVNCIRFLDSRMFVTGSDDKTIAVWDIRNMKHRVQSLIGHGAWVKSLAYMSDKKTLLSSGFDGKILAWEMNRPTVLGKIIPAEIVELSGLMRMTLTPDNSKMIVSNSSGYLITFHDLDIKKMRKQYLGIKPSLYRLMQVSGIPLKPQLHYSPLFVAKKNRLELISDFPSGNECCAISSLVVHPDGTKCISRHATSSENAEFSCVHDIDGPKICTKYPPTDPSDSEEDESSTDDEGGDDSEDLFRSPRTKRPRLVGSYVPPLNGAGGIGMAGGVIGITFRGSYGIEVSLNEGGSDRRDRASRMGSIRPLPEEGEGEGGGGSSNGGDRRPGMTMVRNRLIRLRNRFIRGAERRATRAAAEGESSSTDAADRPPFRRRPIVTSRITGSSIDDSDTDEENPVDGRSGNASTNVRDANPVRLHLLSYETWNALTAIREARQRQGQPASQQTGAPAMITRRESRWSLYSTANRSLIKRHLDGECKCSVPIRQLIQDGAMPDDIFPNVPRMSHYIEEANLQHGYIKEIAISPDGRVIASPYGNGHRLLMFDSECRLPGPPKPIDVTSEVADSRYGTASVLVEASTSFGHSSTVLCAQFAPDSSALVTGCLDGKIVWHHPSI